jgi:protein gp37
MGDRSKIEWTDASWNPIRGCARVSEGCRNCYAERLAARFNGPGQPYEGLAVLKEIKHEPLKSTFEPRWTGAIRILDDKMNLPFRWKSPRRIFVNSMSDLFYEPIPRSLIDNIFAVMALCERHSFQVLTKRVRRMCDYTNSMSTLTPSDSLVARVARRAEIRAKTAGEDVSSPYFDMWLEDWPLKNIWLGASAENQETYDARRRDLENTNAAVIWWSLEPLLGPIRLNLSQSARLPNWIVVGGESGPGARAMHPDWVRRIRDDCVKHHIPFFFKQWGEWIAIDQVKTSFDASHIPRSYVGQLMVWRVGKHNTTRTLDGYDWSEYPR